ncbi:glycosyltransferase family protein [Pseudodesulfovibrio methanolicus]|uniref:Glycosyltransferase family protein n=1 Tax=Pseudodesulfovibrio methanolicus TaxID=3126690 RepID=A0ABZ2J0X5_9BACT
MARIIYGVMGDSGGHINRSLAVAREMDEHEFLFVGGGRVLEAERHGYRYSSLPMISTVLRDNRVHVTGTVANFGHIILGYQKIVAGLCRQIEEFKPDLAITDYEFFLPKAARQCGLHCISLDHQHSITNTVHTPPSEQTVSRLITTGIIKALFSCADKYVVSSFFSLPGKDNTTVVPPILHRDVLEVAPSEGSHVLVYMRSGVGKNLLQGLQSTGRTCRIYGTQETGSQGDLHFMPPSREGFLTDLAASAYVICNGGHTLTSEALHLGKPVLALPTELFYEQFLNAHFLKKLGYGDFTNAHEENNVALCHFDKHHNKHRKILAEKNFFGNTVIADTIRSLADSY